jgi:hypothetical protein
MPIRSSGPNSASSSISDWEQISALQMQVVADLQRARGPHPQKLRRNLPGIARPAHATLAFDGAHADRVEHGGDAAGRKLRVMGDDGRAMGPVGGGARADMPLQVVGMKLHEASGDDIARAIDRATRHMGAARDFHDLAAAQGDAALHLAARQDQPRIGKGQGLGHDGQVFRHGGLDGG